MEVVVAHRVRLRIFVRDPDRARAFYAHVFGWQLPADDGQRCCWVITSGDDPRLGTDGPDGIDAARPDLFMPAVHVADLDATTAAALAAGGEVLVPRIPVPRAGWLVYLADTEGNVVAIMHDDPSATWPPAPATDAGLAAAGGAESGPDDVGG
jgi:predicted enzyme related to lactoylglutathione lyase